MDRRGEPAGVARSEEGAAENRVRTRKAMTYGRSCGWGRANVPVMELAARMVGAARGGGSVLSRSGAQACL